MWPPQAIALTFELPEGSLADAIAALEIATALGDERPVISAQIHLGCALTLRGRYEEAIERLRHAVDETARTDDLVLRGQALNNCAEAEKRAGRLLEAIERAPAVFARDRPHARRRQLRRGVTEQPRRTEPRPGRARRGPAVLLGFHLAGRPPPVYLAGGRLAADSQATLRAKANLDCAREQFALSLGLYHRTSARLTDELRAELEWLAHA